MPNRRHRNRNKPRAGKLGGRPNRKNRDHKKAAQMMLGKKKVKPGRNKISVPQPKGVSTKKPVRTKDIDIFKKLPPDQQAAFILFQQRLISQGSRVWKLQDWLSGGRPQAPKGWTYTAPVEGVPNRVDPFLTPEQMLQSIDYEDAYRGDRDQLGYDLAQFAADVASEKKDIHREASGQRIDVTDDAIGRGLFQSSIRDSALWDVDKWETTNVQRLDDHLKMMNDQTAAKIDALDKSFLRKGSAFKAMAASNAQAAETTGEKWKVKPAPGRWDMPARPQPTQKPKPQGTIGSAGKATRNRNSVGNIRPATRAPKRPRRPNRPRRPKAGTFGRY